MMMKSMVLIASAATVAAQQVVPPNTFGIVQSMSFTSGSGDDDDIMIVCTDQVAAAQATTETSTLTLDPAPTADDAYSYFLAVVLANAPYTLDGSESQEFIDIYDCAANTVPHWNAWDPNAPTTPSDVDIAAGEHACGALIGMDYGGNPSCECENDRPFSVNHLPSPSRSLCTLGVTVRSHTRRHACHVQTAALKAAHQTRRALPACSLLQSLKTWLRAAP
jgi:hypothetical protein